MTVADPKTPREVLAAELADAIEQRRLQLYFQPIVSLIDRVATEVEALPRWPRGGRDILAPSDFIDVAYEFDLVAELERWSIEAAFNQLARWRRSSDLDISLNISEERVYSDGLANEIAAAAEATGAPPTRLSLEVSETAIIEAGEDRLEKLRRLSTSGVRLIIDDYAGGVEKERIAQLPIRALKISRRIVAGIPDNPSHTETAAAALRLAGELGVRVVANGIESPGQFAALRDMGCEHGQGFLFSIPMPAEVLEERAMPR